MNKIFVYGTLKRGFMLHDALSDSKFLGEAETADEAYAMYDGGCPTVSRTEYDPGVIYGEVFEVTDAVLARLDRIEGHPHLYCREQVEIKDHGLCWLYFADFRVEREESRIHSGKWEW